MSSSDYYKRQALPPIRSVLGDQLGQPQHQDSVYPFTDVHRFSQSSSTPSRSRSTWPQTTGPALAPIHPLSHASASTSRSHSHSHSNTHSHSYHSSSESHAKPGAPAAPYSFDVFRPTSSGLVHASSSSRSQGILRSTRADAGRRHGPPSPPDDEEEQGNDKKYPCPHCGKRFSRPSSLKTHEVVHSDEKPYECPHPGCGKTFTVPSNMRRHYRKTHEGAGSGDEDADEHYYSHSHSHTRPPSGHSGSTQYYTSTRR